LTNLSYYSHVILKNYRLWGLSMILEDSWAIESIFDPSSGNTVSTGISQDAFTISNVILEPAAVNSALSRFENSLTMSDIVEPFAVVL
jgi:hypothetical protein